MESQGKLSLTIKRIERHIEDDILIISFLSTDGCFMLQFQDDLTPDEIELGWTKYYLGYCDGAAGNYSCIKKIVFSTRYINLHLNELGQKTFNYSELEFMIERADQKINEELKERFLGDNVEVLFV